MYKGQGGPELEVPGVRLRLCPGWSDGSLPAKGFRARLLEGSALRLDPANLTLGQLVVPVGGCHLAWQEAPSTQPRYLQRNKEGKKKRIEEAANPPGNCLADPARGRLFAVIIGVCSLQPRMRP